MQPARHSERTLCLTLTHKMHTNMTLDDRCVNEHWPWCIQDTLLTSLRYQNLLFKPLYHQFVVWPVKCPKQPRGRHLQSSVEPKHKCFSCLCNVGQRAPVQDLIWECGSWCSVAFSYCLVLWTYSILDFLSSPTEHEPAWNFQTPSSTLI